MSLLRKPRIQFLGAGLDNFSGGLNLSASASELGPADVSEAYNVTLDEQGGINCRLGFQSNGVAYAGGPVSSIYASQAIGQVILQAGTKLYRADGLLLQTFSTSDRCAMVDFHGKLLFVHPVDGLFSYTVAGGTVAIGAGPKADALAVWQNRVWSNNRDTLLPKSRVRMCAIGDETTWADSVDLRNVDDAQVVALIVEGGLSSIGRAGLLAFKQRSSVRIYDSTSGANQTVSANVGAASPRSVVGLLGETIVLSETGVYRSTTGGVFQKVSGKLDPLFAPDVIDVSNVANFAAGSNGKRVYLSLLTTAVSPSPYQMVEYDPLEGWFTLNSNYASCYGWDGSQLVTGDPVLSNLWVQNIGGSDYAGSVNSRAISSAFRTRFVELNGGMRARLNRARVNGRGSFTLDVHTDYDSISVATRSVNLPSADSTHHGGYQDLLSLGAAKAFAFRITASSTSADHRITTIPGFSTVQSGAWGLFGIDLSGVPLGRL